MMKTKTMTLKNARRTSGFTMVELLIAIIIIGILVTIIVPVLSNRAADARLAAAKADMEAIANAESQVALDTGYVVRLHVLDDSGARGDGIGSLDPDDVVDSLEDEQLNNSGLPTQVFLDAKTGLFLPATIWDRAVADAEQFGWRGPYVNFHRKYKNDGLTPIVWVGGAPLDPWGNPYFLFVPNIDPLGGTGSGRGAWIDELNGTLSTTFNYNGFSVPADRFDRLTLLSLGPDGIPGSGTINDLGSGDDLIRAF